MKFTADYDIPAEMIKGEHTEAFNRFLEKWFANIWDVTGGRLELTFLEQLRPDELRIARELIRRNLKLRYDHIIQGVSALHDVEAAPLVRRLYDTEPDISRRLVMAGVLWKLLRDPVFMECLDEAKAMDDKIFLNYHALQILWLGDERAVKFLIDLLDQKDEVVRDMTLRQLNELELGRRMLMIQRELPRKAEDYRRRRNDKEFLDHMVAAIQAHNAKMKNGW